MAVTAFWYGLTLRDQYGTTAANRVDYATDTIKIALTTSAYAQDQDAHDFFNDVTNEITGTGYTAGGTTLAGKAVTYDTGTNEVRIDANDAAWTTATFTANKAVHYKDTGTASTSHLISYVLFGGDQTVNSANFTIQWDTTGICKITVS